MTTPRTPRQENNIIYIIVPEFNVNKRYDITNRRKNFTLEILIDEIQNKKIVPSNFSKELLAKTGVININNRRVIEITNESIHRSLFGLGISNESNLEFYTSKQNYEKYNHEKKQTKIKAENMSSASNFEFNMSNEDIIDDKKITSLEKINIGRPPTNEEIQNTKIFMTEMETKTHAQVTMNDILLYTLSKMFSANDIGMVISKTEIENDETMQLHAKLWLTGSIFDCKIYEVKFEKVDDKNFNVDYLKSNLKLEQFIKEFKEFIAASSDLKPENIKVIDIKKGSVATIFISNHLDINKVSNFRGYRPLNASLKSIREYSLNSILINSGIFNHAYDINYTSEYYRNLVERRGKENYYPPFGWQRIGLNLSYFPFYQKNFNLNWLTMTNHDDEWSVAFHGTKAQFLNKIIYDSTNKPTLRTGVRQNFAWNFDQNIRNIEGYGELCGDGIYCSPRIEVAECYTSEVPFDGKYYKIALQCRINPKKLRNTGYMHDNIEESYYYVINNPDDIRPYGILLNIT